MNNEELKQPPATEQPQEWAVKEQNDGMVAIVCNGRFVAWAYNKESGDRLRIAHNAALDAEQAAINCMEIRAKNAEEQLAAAQEHRRQLHIELDGADKVNANFKRELDAARDQLRQAEQQLAAEREKFAKVTRRRG
jgi:predicted RNase H-like nuclease (RuvC/YqgF family)